jgi:hypothetical protein
MSQKLIEQFNQEDMALLEQMEDLIESAELELQKTATLLELKTSTEQAFEGVTAITKEIENIALQLKQEDTRLVASERIALFTIRFNEVINQVKN